MRPTGMKLSTATLSNLDILPSLLTLEPGVNTVSGNITAMNDEDYINMYVPGGTQLEAIILLNHSSSANPTLFAMDYNTVYQSVLLQDTFGYAEADASSIGEDLLQDMAISNGKFNPPLPINTFTLWIHQEEGSIDYSLEFIVTSGTSIINTPNSRGCRAFPEKTKTSLPRKQHIFVIIKSAKISENPYCGNQYQGNTRRNLANKVTLLI